jgi:dihydroorotate dehydrogenase electron transfer subunit
VYTSDVPVDVDAAVIANRRLSEDYCVLSLAAPEIARRAQPGQFVMVKTSGATDPLLRRPFSIFEILRDGAGALTGITILNKQIGSGTRLLYAAAPGMRLACLGPLGRPFEPVTPPAEAWMIAGGVGLAPFATLATALLAAGTTTTLFYGARRASDLHCIERFEPLGMRVVVTTEDGSRGIRGYVTAALGAELATRSRSDYVKLYACGPTPMMRAVARLADTHDRDCDVSLEQVMGCGLGGCYSCVVPAGRPGVAPHLVRSCLEGPVFDARRLAWDALAH